MRQRENEGDEELTQVDISAESMEEVLIYISILLWLDVELYFTRVMSVDCGHSSGGCRFPDYFFVGPSLQLKINLDCGFSA